MKVYLTDYCYDSTDNVIRTKGRNEFTKPTLIFAVCLLVLFLILAPLFELSRLFALLGLLPLIGLLRPLKTKVLFSKDGQVVRFYETTRVIDLDPQEEIHCQVREEYGDSYFTRIYYGDGDKRITLVDSTDFISQDDFNRLFCSLFENLRYDFTVIP